jgi:hypothetical protein
MIEQQLLPPVRPSCWVGGMSPYKLHHDRVQLEGLGPHVVMRRGEGIQNSSFKSFWRPGRLRVTDEIRVICRETPAQEQRTLSTK